jgi:hypothetical protein
LKHTCSSWGTVNTLAIAIIFADDTSLIISSKNLDYFCMLSKRVLSLMSKWFAANKLALKLDKTNRGTFKLETPCRSVDS